MNLISLQKYCSRFVVIISKRYKSVEKSSETKMKVFLQKRNPLTGSTEWDIGGEHDEYDYHQEIARSAFADMLHDTERNNMYYRALQLAIDKMHRDGKKANVLDIGTGTGLLSMMAAKCGADTITACEAFKPMAECCLKIIEQNGYADKIKVIPKRSTEIIVGEGGDMDQRANILVTEVFDTELIGEGALSTFSHAHEHLLEEDCIVVPDSAVIYAQVVECPFLQRWNKLEDVIDPELGVVLKTPQKIRSCSGTAAAHDLQLSQLPRSSFRELSDKIPVFHYDWSGKSPILKNGTVKRAFTARDDGTAQVVFMWWDLNMDTEGRIVLSCAPAWARREAAPAPAPWRDHWLQAAYYLPADAALHKGQESTLVACHDEYSLWFLMEEGSGARRHARPACSCGVHVAWSRTHLAHVNERGRAPLRTRLPPGLSADSVVLDLNGSSPLGLLAARLARRVYVLERSRLDADILREYMTENEIENAEPVSELAELAEGALRDVTHVVFEPARAEALLPWDALRPAGVLLAHAALRGVPVRPAVFRLWGMPVEFLDLHKIRVPVGGCEGFDLAEFDRLVEGARCRSDACVEPQPLWEYPARCSGAPRELLRVRLQELRPQYVADRSPALTEWSGSGEEPEYPVNGFALWAEWDDDDDEGGEEEGGAAPRGGRPALGEVVQWDPHTRQAVHILRAGRTVKASAQWRYRVSCDLRTSHWHVAVGLRD